jgi:hypothetical protein
LNPEESGYEPSRETFLPASTKNIVPQLFLWWESFFYLSNYSPAIYNEPQTGQGYYSNPEMKDGSVEKPVDLHETPRFELVQAEGIEPPILQGASGLQPDERHRSQPA